MRSLPKHKRSRDRGGSRKKYLRARPLIIWVVVTIEQSAINI